MDATTTSECDTGNIVGETCELDIAADCLDVLTTLAQTEHASASTRARRIVLERVLTAVPTDEMVTEVDLQSQIAGSVLGSIEVLRRRELEVRGRCKFALAMLRFFRSLLVQTQWFALCPDVQAVFDHVDAHEAAMFIAQTSSKYGRIGLRFHPTWLTSFLMTVPRSL